MSILKFIQPNFEVPKSVAVVGSSDNILLHEHGPSIDSHDAVIRFNRQPTEGYEPVVGAKTTARVVNVHVFQSLPLGRWKVDRYFVQRLQDTTVIVLSGLPRIISERDKHIDKSVELYVLDNTGLRVPTGKLTNVDVGARPSVGMSIVLGLILSGYRPDVYGWDVKPGALLSHYWEARDQKSPCHNIENERKALRILRDKDLLEIK